MKLWGCKHHEVEKVNFQSQDSLVNTDVKKVRILMLESQYSTLESCEFRFNLITFGPEYYKLGNWRISPDPGNSTLWRFCHLCCCRARTATIQETDRLHTSNNTSTSGVSYIAISQTTGDSGPQSGELGGVLLFKWIPRIWVIWGSTPFTAQVFLCWREGRYQRHRTAARSNVTLGHSPCLWLAGNIWREFEFPGEYSFFGRDLLN